jgi:hypothetical protein
MVAAGDGKEEEREEKNSPRARPVKEETRFETTPSTPDNWYVNMCR